MIFEAVDLYIDIIYLTFKGEAIEAVILKLLYINYHMPKPLSYAVVSSWALFFTFRAAFHAAAFASFLSL
jgi:hypothetical protein